jgi:hypothetical protein
VVVVQFCSRAIQVSILVLSLFVSSSFPPAQKVHVHCWEPKGAVATSFNTRSIPSEHLHPIINPESCFKFIRFYTWDMIFQKALQLHPGMIFWMILQWMGQRNPAPVDISVVKRCSTSHFVGWMDHPNLVVHRNR